MERKRIRDFGIVPGVMKTGPKNKITDVPGVLVGHKTVRNGDNKTGVTVIVPGPGNVFERKFIAAGYVHNGFGKTCGLVQVEELGTLETPIALTNTLNVGLAADALVEYTIRQCEKDQVEVTSVSPVVGECNDCRINRIQHRAVSMEDVMEAFSGAGEDFEEGDVGAGTGTVCYGLKGGIGSASRVMEVTSVSPVVGECNDCRINRIQHRAVSMEDVMEAFSGAGEDFEEGDVGAGTGTVCYGLKGGIGSASRVMRIGGVNYTLGVLVQSNFGATEDLVIDGIRAGQRILEEKERRRKMATAEQDQGSIMTIIATDLPVSDRQLKRIIRRAGVGIARTGAYTGHGSGEVMIGFTTAGRLQGKDSPEIMTSTCIREDLINVAFKAAAEAVNEAILNSMTAAGRTGGLAGEVYYSLSEFLPQILKH